MRSGNVDLDALLALMRHGLRQLPRHEWDSYLWQLGSRIVAASDRDRAVYRAPAGSEPSESEAR